MKKASKILLNISGLFGIVSAVSLLPLSAFMILIIVYGIIGSFSSSGYVGIIFTYVFILGSIILFLMIIAFVLLLIGGIFSFIGIKNKKRNNIINIIFSTFGLLPIICLGLPILLIVLLSLYGLFGAVYGFISLYEYPVYFFAILMGLCALISLSTYLLFSGAVAKIGGLLYGILSLVGGILGIVPPKKPKNTEEIEEKTSI